MIMTSDKMNFTEPLIHPISINNHEKIMLTSLSEESHVNIQLSSTSNSERNNDYLTIGGETHNACKYLETDECPKPQTMYNFLPSISNSDLTKCVFASNVAQPINSSNLVLVENMDHSVGAIPLQASNASSLTVQQTSNDLECKQDTYNPALDINNSDDSSLNGSSNKAPIFLSSFPTNSQNIVNYTCNLNFGQTSKGSLVLFPNTYQMIQTGSSVRSFEQNSNTESYIYNPALDINISRNNSLNGSSNQPPIFLSYMPANSQNQVNYTSNLNFGQTSDSTSPLLPYTYQLETPVASLDQIYNSESSSRSSVAEFQFDPVIPINERVSVSTNLTQPHETSNKDTIDNLLKHIQSHETFNNKNVQILSNASNKTECRLVNIQSPALEFEQNAVSTLKSSNNIGVQSIAPNPVSIPRPSAERNQTQQEKIETVSRTAHNQTQINGYNHKSYNASYSNRPEINLSDKGTESIDLGISEGEQSGSFNSKTLNLSRSDVKIDNSKNNLYQLGQTLTSANSEIRTYSKLGQRPNNSKKNILEHPTRPRMDISYTSAPTGTSLDELLRPLFKYIKGNKCTLCGFETASKDLAPAIRSHLETHLHSKMFKCKECEKGFVTSQRLSLQKSNLHSNEGPVECMECGKKYLLNFSLKHHVRIHNQNIRKHTCMVCGMEYKRFDNLKKHLRIHAGERPYACTVCNQSFRAKHMLDTHSKHHLAEKNKKCTVCSKAYNNMSVLNKHMHNKNSPHLCKICNKSFSYRFNLVQHTFIHSNARKHKCVVCGMKYKLPHHLKSHLLRAHTDINT